MKRSRTAARTRSFCGVLNHGWSPDSAATGRTVVTVRSHRRSGATGSGCHRTSPGIRRSSRNFECSTTMTIARRSARIIRCGSSSSFCSAPTRLTNSKVERTMKLKMKNALSVGFISLVAAASPAVAQLRVVATTPDLASVAREIGGNKVSVVALAKPTEDPHYVDAKPSHVVTLNRADALIEGGAEL